MTGQLTAETIAALPKVVLHDHLDGGLRPETIVELAGQAGHTLPTEDPAELGAWFVRTATAGTLEGFLSTFEHTIAVMQTADNLRRVAREAVVDLAADGVVYAEQRYAPGQHLAGGLTREQVVEAVAAGLEEGVQEAAGAGRRIVVGQIVSALRQHDDADEVAALALAHRDRGVVGFDIAGDEAGFALARHETALRTLRMANLPATVHAGEAAGPDSIADAVHLGGAVRIGHGVRIADDITFGPVDEVDRFGVDGAVLGPLANWVRDNQIPLELCPTSNTQTGAAASIAEHPITALAHLGFAVTVNTDNRLMSGTTMTGELLALVEQAGWTRTDIFDVTLTAAWNTFRHQDERSQLIEELIYPGFVERKKGRHRA